MDRTRFIDKQQTSIYSSRSNFWERISIYRNLSWPRWGIKRDHDPKKYRVNKRSHKYLSVLSVILLSPAQVLANAVSQSNNGSVTNMAVKTLTGNMTTNQYGGNIVLSKGQPYPSAHSPLLEQITSSLIGTTMKHPSTIQQMLMTMVYQITQAMYFSIKRIILERIKIVML